MGKPDIIINRESNISICDQIVNQITRKISSGELEIGERLPTERELAEALNISRGTIKKAFLELEKSNIIESRQGSGRYVLSNGSVLDQSQKKQATAILNDAFTRLESMGLSHNEILNIIRLQLSDKTSMGKVSIMVVSNNNEILLKLENQLSYLSSKWFSHFTLSFMTFDNIKSMSNPSQLLLGYDLIIASVIDFPALVDMVPMYLNKIVKVTLSPMTRTLVALSSLPRDSRLSVIYRTASFRDMVLNSLIKLGFQGKNIFPVNENDYNPTRHSDNGVSAIINFNESPIYTDIRFKQRNEDFLLKGGKIIHFEYCIDRSSLSYIEEQIQRVLEEKRSVTDTLL